jgi:adenylate cyclase
MRACLTALKMMEELKVLEEEFKKRDLPIIDIGIGVNSGDMSVGNMGSKQRFDYTVMGDNVNLGSRLEGINKQYQTNIIISEYTYEHVKDTLLCRKLDAVKVKGKNEPVVIYELVSKHKHNKDLLDISKLTEQGIDFYWKKNWDEAINIFNKILIIKENDFLSKMYIDRCSHFKENPPEENWDGSFKMTTK